MSIYNHFFCVNINSYGVYLGHIWLPKNGMAANKIARSFWSITFPRTSSSGINLIVHMEHLLDLLQTKYPLRVYHFAITTRRKFFNDIFLQPQDFHLAEYSFLTSQNLYKDINNPNVSIYGIAFRS